MYAAAKIEEWIREGGLKKGFFAQRIGVSKSTLSLILRKGYVPSMPVRIAIEHETDGHVSREGWDNE